MKMPKADPGAVRRFVELLPASPEVVQKPMFGHPAAFRRGHLFFGVFGADVFVRLGPEDRAEAAKLPGSRPFAPMAGRPMREYVVLPPAVLEDRKQATRWVAKAVEFTDRLPAKEGPRPRERAGRGA